MKTFSLNKNSLNIQKCLLPESDFVKKNFGSFAFVPNPGGSQTLVKIGLCQHKQTHETCWIDESVVKFSSTKERPDSRELDVNNLKITQTVGKAKTVSLTVVYNDVFDMKKNDPDVLKLLLKDILKLFVITGDSIVFLDNLLNSQNLNIYCIIIHSVNDDGLDVYRVTGATNIFIKKTISRLKFEGITDVHIGGCDKIYRTLREMVEFSNQKLLLVGPPGCGKTSLVKKVAKEADCVLLEVLAPDINVSQPGETEKKLKEIFNKAKCHAENGEKCLVLIDEIDSICIKNEEMSGVTKRTIRQLIILLEEVKKVDGVVVIATTNNPDEIDNQLRRSNCFDEELELFIPDLNDRIDIIKSILKFYNMVCEDGIIQEVANWTPGFVGADLNLIVLEAKSLYEKGLDLKTCFRKAVLGATPTGLKGAMGLQVLKETEFSEIGGLDKIISLLNFSVKQQLLHPENYLRLGIPLTKGILLYGPPGCAKTTLVKALAKECNTTFLAVSAADLFSPFVGDAERLVVKLFSQARIGAPAIIFIDEIDAIVGSKSGREKGVQERVLSALLVEMDGVGVRVKTTFNKKILEGEEISSEGDRTFKDENNNGIIVIGATNRPELIDDALIRPGRFDKLIHVPCPNKVQRLDILKKVCRNMPLDESVDLELIAEKTECYSGADLKNLCMEAGLQVLTEEGMGAESMKQKYFEEVLRRIKPSLDEKHLNSAQNFWWK